MSIVYVSPLQGERPRRDLANSELNSAPSNRMTLEMYTHSSKPMTVLTEPYTNSYFT
jgi:hypothetical protein